MPRRIETIPDKQDAIVRPVAMQVTRQLIQALEIPSNIRIIFPGLWEEGPQTGSTVDDDDKEDPSSFNYYRKMRIEVTETPVEDAILTAAVHRKDQHPIFLDEKLKIAIYPITVSTKMQIAMTYRATSRAEAKQFRDTILTRVAEGRTTFFHELDYHYNIPYPLMKLLEDVHTLREAVAGYGEDFETWVNNCITPRATNTATLIGSQKKVSIRERQISPWGFFDFTGTPEEAQKEKEGATVHIELNYTFYYDQVIGCVAQYPLSVHGQFIQEQWYQTPHASGRLIEPLRSPRQPTISRGYFDVISHQTPNWERLQYEPVKLPYFDDWSAEYTLPFTTNVVQAMVGVSPERPTELFKISDIEEFSFEPVILEFLRSEAEYACDFKQSIFHCQLFEDYNFLSDDVLRLTSDLQFYSTRPLDPRKQYHVEINLVHTLNNLTDNAIYRLRHSGEAGIRILEWLQQKLRGFAYIPELLGGVIRQVDIRQIAEILDRRPGRDQDRFFPNGIMKTAGQFGIIAHRRIPE